MTESAQPAEQALYQHSKRKEWGLALLAWERDGKRGYQFEDGELRIFKEGYYRLLEEVPEVENKATIIARLDAKRAGAAKKDDKKKRGSARSKVEDMPTPGEQVLVFTSIFPGGFDDPKWIKDHRGEGGRALKRHRDHAIKRAQEELAKESLDALLDAGQSRSVIERACTVLDKTDLVSKAQVDPLRNATRDTRLAQSIRDFLHGTDDVETRFAHLCRAIATSTKKPPSWQLATALGALVHPQEHVCVRPSVFSLQALTMAPRLRPSKTPTSMAYVGYVKMSKAVIDQRISDGQTPRDLLDVHDFIWVTLRPAAKEVLEQIRIDAAASPPAPEPAAAPADATSQAAPAGGDAPANEAPSAGSGE